MRAIYYHLKKWMVSWKMNPTFTEIDFYDYKIRMGVVDTTPMYLVSDLLRQYNEKHGTNKRFVHYLENKQAQEVIEYMAKSVGWNSGLPSKEGQNEGSNTVAPNSGLLSEEGQNKHSTENGTFSAEDDGDKWNIPHVIQYITYNRGYCEVENSPPHPEKANQGYIVCEDAELIYFGLH